MSPRRTRRSRFPASLATVLAALAVLVLAAPGGAVEIPITSVAGFPNGRTLNELPPNAIDGDTTTFTWTTNPNSTASPSHLAIGFDSAPVDRIRLWKARDGGGGQNIKNLTIQYTTDPTGVPLASRTWITVTGLVNGHQSTELMDATAVNANGTVDGDIHDSAAGDGWASLRFDQVVATGLRISFANPNPVAVCDGVTPNGACNHYRVGEFEAHGPVPVPAIGGWGMAMIGLVVAAAGAWAFRRPRAGTA